MVSSAPTHTTPSLRGMRETYVNLLLSNGQQPVEAGSHTPRATWTPGQSLGAAYKEHAVHWASPVTPGLTENEMRVAEVAANLVAAGDAEKRNKDALRILADKLEETERKNRKLEAAVRTEEKKKKEKRRVSYGDARRNIHFTPRTPRRSAGLEVSGERRHSRKLEREWFHDTPFHIELESLRMQRVQWYQEREKFRSMMSDIKRNTCRLLEERNNLRCDRNASVQERNDHLQVIARLQDQLMEMKQREEHLNNAVGHGSRSPIDPTPRCGEEDSVFPDLTSKHGRNFSPVSLIRAPHVLSRHEENECPDHDYGLTATAKGETKGVPSEGGICEGHDGFGREEELQAELYLVNEENVRVSDQNATLEAENAQLKERIHILETDRSNFLNRVKEGEGNAAIETGASDSSAVTAETELANLLEEINILESVSLAIHFEISPSEADRAQETLSDMGSLTSEREALMIARGGRRKERRLDTSKRHEPGDLLTTSPAHVIKSATYRLSVIRTDLCSKYGKWLEAVANDVSSAGGATGVESVDKENMLLFEVASECMNTKVINELVER